MADGRHLPDLPAVVRRRRRRRHRRPAGHHGAADDLADARRRRGLAQPRSTARRRTTPATTSPTTATSIRCSARWPTSTRCSPRPTTAASGSSSTSCPTTPPTSTRGSRRRWPPARARRSAPATIFRDGTGPDGDCRPTTGSRVRRSRLDRGSPGRPVVPAPVRPVAARLRLGQPGGARRVRARSCASGSTAASTASGSTSPTACQGPTACPTYGGRRPSCRARWPATARRTGTRTACTRSTATGARSSTSTPATGSPSPRPGSTGRRARAPLRAPRRDAPGVQLRLPADAAGTPRRCARSIDDSLAAYGPVGAPATWVLSNHDVVRHATRSR